MIRRVGMFLIVILYFVGVVGLAEAGNAETIKVNGKKVVKDISINNKFKQLRGFGPVGFSVDSRSTKLGIFGISRKVSHDNFDITSNDSSEKSAENKFTSEPLDVRSIYEKIDTGLFDTGVEAIKQTYVIKNKDNKGKKVALNILYEIGSDFILWNESVYNISKKRTCFKAFEYRDEMFSNEVSMFGHTLYFGNNYYDFSDVLGFDYNICVYEANEKNYIDLEVKGDVGALSELVIDPIIGWTTHIIYNSTNDRIYSVHATDLDSDGDTDVLSANYNYDEVVWYENNGNESFARHSLPLPVGQMQGIVSVHATDLDSDGDIDILSASIHGDKIAWHENDGSENFTFHYIDTFFDNPYSVYATDLDSDGDFDVLSIGGNKIAWYKNNGSRNFEKYILTSSIDDGYSVYATDLDSDGDTDVLSASRNDDKIAWYENNGSEKFTPHIITTSADDARSVYAVDVDGDNDVDVLSASRNDDKIAWYENNGSEKFTPHIITTSADGAESVRATDLDSDGDIDIISASWFDDKIAWYENNGSENFTPHIITLVMDGADSVCTADLDSDGDIDVVSSNWMTSKVAWYENENEREGSCGGIINIFTEDSARNPMEGLSVYLNGANTKTINFDGFAQYNISNASCSAVQNVEVRCADNLTICGNISTTLSVPEDTDSLTFVCDICRKDKDIFIGKNELKIEEFAGKINVSFLVHSVGIDSSVSIDLVKSCGGTTTALPAKNIFISSGEVKTVAFLDDFSGCEKLDIYVEKFENETSYENNDIRNFFLNPMKIYLEVDTGYSYADSSVEDFIKEHAQIVSYEDADLSVYVGRKLAPNYNGEWGIRNNLIKYNGKTEGLSYNGMIAKEGNKIYLFGNDIDGEIVAVRRFIEGGDKYLNGKNLDEDMEVIYLGEENIDAISVYDYLHTDENDEFYRKDDSNFGDVVNKILRRQTFNLAIKRVLTANDNTSLRLKNVNQEMSPKFREFTNSRPVVLARGLWSNLFSWEGLAREIAQGVGTNQNRDAWLIEITGGPNTECENCPNYDFEDLTTYYWPALIAGVEAYTGEDEIDYVGFSNGCRTALGSLEKYQAIGKSNAGYYMNGSEWVPMGMDADVVNTFVGVGCPGSFEGNSGGKVLMKLLGGSAIEDLENQEINHLTLSQAKIAAIPFDFFALNQFHDEAKISIQLLEDYIDSAKNESDSQFGDFSVNRAVIIEGHADLGPLSNDLIVTHEDIIGIYDNINANNKKRMAVFGTHLDMANKESTKNLISKVVNNEDISWFENLYNLKEEYP